MAYCLICYCKGLSQGWSLFSSITPLAEGIFQRTGFCGLLLWSKVPEDLSNLSVRGIHASGPWQFYGTSIVTFFFFLPYRSTVFSAWSRIVSIIQMQIVHTDGSRSYEGQFFFLTWRMEAEDMSFQLQCAELGLCFTSCSCTRFPIQKKKAYALLKHDCNVQN